MRIEPTDLPGLCLVTPRRYGDARGFFAETFNARTYARAGIDTVFVQDNHSVSEHAGTVRGLHFQAPPHAQAKLLRCGRGRLFDVALDLRVGSTTFGRWAGFELSAENGRQVFIPEGFAHGFMTLEPETEIVYKCSDFYAPESETALRWDDPGLAIVWPALDAPPVLSEKDAGAPCWADFTSPFVMAPA
ncbi:dTDP-4-dehydrorhamnose 3,5-epimerase [Citreimonas salinaria]|uniref:dTDP-4-dehydrorhamnose 3,5-epimerase n=1 Tax=Citreimonas salinaria TaxID=321339 RepID=A0A1H3EZY2_9RHOB|nr:dTDP-4-dehydrorhamnose 3,5-epimerase [Citreimonas salinaria]SDX83529.1 dTDP-4-dehydrorhamnose 3,5-epimerase [Citreimonas salinaria]